jgi:pimeloyl-ACP methyl ester carboxylesterase
MSSTFEVLSGDGTRIRCWRSDTDGVPLVIANGLGTIPEAWPRLIDEASGYAAWTWYHRGTFGSERPADPERIRVEDHVEDMVALMDDQGIDRALVACWSIGVNVAFEMCHRHPERVAGILAVAGVPGGRSRPWAARCASPAGSASRSRPGSRSSCARAPAG